MNAKTPEQRREVCEQLLEVWNDYDEEVGGISLCRMLGLEPLTDTQLVDRLGECCLSDGPIWETFDKRELEGEQMHRFPVRAWDLIADTYKLNPADRLQVRHIIEETRERDAIVRALDSALSKARAKQEGRD